MFMTPQLIIWKTIKKTICSHQSKKCHIDPMPPPIPFHLQNHIPIEFHSFSKTTKRRNCLVNFAQMMMTEQQIDGRTDRLRDAPLSMEHCTLTTTNRTCEWEFSLYNNNNNKHFLKIQQQDRCNNHKKNYI